jgi:3-keto-5-aminohexanoate cleavage enzyme
MKRKILIAVAPVGKNTMEPSNNPLSPEDVAAETIACNREGASMVHLHVRDKTGAQTGDLTHYTKTLNLIRDKSDIIIQGSTGGLSDLSLEERCVSLEEPRTQVASLNMGSTNVADTVYINTMEDIRYWAKRMKETDVIPKMEIFTLGMYTSVQKLVEEGVASGRPGKTPLQFCLGIRRSFAGGYPNLECSKSRLPASASFGVLHEGFDGFAFLAGAVALGATRFESVSRMVPGSRRGYRRSRMPNW